LELLAAQIEEKRQHSDPVYAAACPQHPPGLSCANTWLTHDDDAITTAGIAMDKVLLSGADDHSTKRGQVTIMEAQIGRYDGKEWRWGND
jgi:hypothetical protein